jgi:hypothetical protein
MERPMELNWSDVNYAKRPGMYRLQDGRDVQLSAKHIVQWTDDPDGTFETYWYEPGAGASGQYTLTEFRASGRRRNETDA